jgi:threonine/homoserine/homoserine lactone efflux protein
LTVIDTNQIHVIIDSMHDISWMLFVATSVVLIATPGQDMILVMSRSISQGTAAGVATALGVSTGLLGHTVLAGLGLGALLSASDWLFLAVKLVGAAYLVWLGVGLLRSKDEAIALVGRKQRSRMRLFFDGAFSNLSNPKVALFYFAFLPQFVRPHAAHPTVSILTLGVAFAVLTFLLKAPVALSAGALSSRLRKQPGILRWMHRVSGALFIGLGVKLATERRA